METVETSHGKKVSVMPVAKLRAGRLKSQPVISQSVEESKSVVQLTFNVVPTENDGVSPLGTLNLPSLYVNAGSPGYVTHASSALTRRAESISGRSCWSHIAHWIYNLQLSVEIDNSR